MDSDIDVAAQRNFYDQFWSDYHAELGGWEVRRLAAILEALSHVLDDLRRPPARPRICDLGCGRGWLALELTKFGDVLGVDLSPGGIALAQERYRPAQFECQNILTWRADREFDLVVCSEVIEHIMDKPQLVATIRSILRPGGYAIVTTPNGRLKKAHDRAFKWGQMVEDWSTPSELKTLFANAGFIVQHHETFLLDVLYVGPFRILSAPKLLRLLNTLHLHHIYDGIRTSLHLGLFQVLLVKLV